MTASLAARLRGTAARSTPSRDAATLRTSARRSVPASSSALLRLDLGVAGQQDADTADRRPQDERGVVRVGPGVVERCGRPEDVQVHLPDGEAARRRQVSGRRARADRQRAARPGRRTPDRRAARPAPGRQPGRGPRRPIPPTWSRWKCVNTSSGSRSTPRSLRQRSIATGSGPASISTAAPDPALRTSPSPCPTSHATNTQSGGGQPAVTVRTGIATSSAVTTAAATTTRNPRRRTAAAQQSSASEQHDGAGTAAGPRHGGAVQPAEEVGVGHQPPAGPAGDPGQQRRAAEPEGASSAAAKPSTVVTATTGSASTLAGTATRLTLPGDRRRRPER